MVENFRTYCNFANDVISFPVLMLLIFYVTYMPKSFVLVVKYFSYGSFKHALLHQSGQKELG